MSISIYKCEDAFLKIFKITVLAMMALTLVSSAILITYAAYQFLQHPKEPIPAQKAPEKQINMEGLTKSLIEREIKKNKEEKPDIQPTKIPPATKPELLYSEDATAIYRCSIDFSKSVGASVDEMDNATNIQKIEALRAVIERLASYPHRGDSWVKSSAEFTCKTLKDPSIIEMKKQGKIGQVLMPALTYHLNNWDEIQSEKIRFNQSEEDRILQERTAEMLRVNKAKSSVTPLLIGAAGAFSLFMALALYLLGYRIENNLKNINKSIQDGLLRTSNNK